MLYETYVRVLVLIFPLSHFDKPGKFCSTFLVAVFWWLVLFVIVNRYILLQLPKRKGVGIQKLCTALYQIELFFSNAYSGLLRCTFLYWHFVSYAVKKIDKFLECRGSGAELYFAFVKGITVCIVASMYVNNNHYHNISLSYPVTEFGMYQHEQQLAQGPIVLLGGGGCLGWSTAVLI